MRITTAIFGIMTAFATLPAAADGPVVIELFTSQGCSSCPPADEMMVELAQRDDVIALAFHVDYWDYIGWVDVFGSPENTTRQKQYARAAGARTVYTPQFVVGGADHVIGARGMELSDAIGAHRDVSTGVSVDATRVDQTITITLNAVEPQPMNVLLVRYSDGESVNILRGENAGETISYVNTVMAWNVIAEWDGVEPLSLNAEIDGDFPSVVLVQGVNGGPVVAAADVR